MCRFFMCAEHGTNQSLNGKRKPILAPKISFKKNNEEVANVYLTQTAGRKRLTFSGKSFILNPIFDSWKDKNGYKPSKHGLCTRFLFRNDLCYIMIFLI